MSAENPRIIESHLADGCEVGVFSEVIKSTLASGARVYRMARVQGSTLGAMSHVGDHSRLDFSELGFRVRIDRFNHIFKGKLGDHSYTGPQTVVMSATVGRFCSISWGVTVGGANHDYTRVTTHSFLYNDHDKLRPAPDAAYNRFASNCRVGNDVWIAANSTILPGTTLGDGAVIAAGSVVTHDVPPYTVVAGVPARVIKTRFDESVAQRLLEIRWWDFPDDLIRSNFDLFKAHPDQEILEKLESIRDGLDASRGPDVLGITS